MTPADLDATARTVWAEARGEGFDGMKAVAHVIINRWKQRHRKESTLCGVATEPWQFSAWNPGDVNRELLDKIGLDNQWFRLAMAATLIAFHENVVEGSDPTNGSTHYHTVSQPDWATLWPPKWAQHKHWAAVIGEHLFYNDVD